MEDVPYSKREQDHFRDDVTSRFDKQDVTLTKILDQTTKHNGRMGKIEDWIGEAKLIIESNTKGVTSLKNDRTRIYTFIGIMTVVAGAIGYLYVQLIDSKISEAVSISVPAAINSKFDSIEVTK